MPVPSTINDLSTTAGSNSPAGSESPALIDDYLRTHASFIKQVNDESVKLTGDQTVSGTKTLSTNPVLSGGTANGVLYLNGSKAVSSGSGLVFDGSNLGLGVTPSAWNSSFKAFEVFPQTVIYGFPDEAGFGRNFYFDGGGSFRYKTNGYAFYLKITDKFIWNTAPYGTAGNPISFTQAMTLDASGNLNAIGNFIANGSYIGNIGTVAYNNSVNKSIYLGASNFDSVNNGAAYQWGLNVSGDATGQSLRFVRSRRGEVETESARIDNSGNLLVGTTSAIQSGYKVHIFPSASSGGGIAWKNFDTAASNPFAAFFNSAGTLIGSINCSNTATSFITSSDYRLKHNVAPMQGALARVKQLKPCTYKWNADGSDGEGFIAHELAEVCPQAVTGEKDAVDADGKPVYQGIDTSFLVATLTAAIQEQQAIITELRSRIEALEAK